MQAFVFPGQGSQAVGMGRELYDAFPEAKEVFQEINDALNQDLTKIMFEGPDDQLTLTENAQPALMTVSMAVVKILEKAGFDVKEKADFFAGHSLGEYSALCAAGALSIADTARLLKIRGTSMQAAVPVGQGAMAALIGMEADAVSSLAQESAQGDVCAVANDNSPGQLVISGHKQAVERAIENAAAAGAKKCVMLPVSAPFHCALMQPAADRMAEALAEVEMLAPAKPIVMNVLANTEKDPARIKDLLVQQVTGQVRWRESMQKMKTLGVETIVEAGSGKVLTGLLRRIDRELKGSALNTPQDIEEFLK